MTSLMSWIPVLPADIAEFTTTFASHMDTAFFFFDWSLAPFASLISLSYLEESWIVVIAVAIVNWKYAVTAKSIGTGIASEYFFVGRP
jgi:hypothetical protein